MLYLWSKGRAPAPSGKAPKFESKCHHLSKKKRFLEKRLFFSFFCSFFFYWTFCQLPLFPTITSFSLVSLTLGLHAPNLAYAFSTSLPLDPCLHLHKPWCTYGAAPTQTDVLCLLCHLFQAAEAKETLPVSGLCAASVGIGTPTCPQACFTTVSSLLTSLSSFLAVISRLVKTTLIFVVHT